MHRYTNKLDEKGRPIRRQMVSEDYEEFIRRIAREEAKTVAVNELVVSGFPEELGKRQELVIFLKRFKYWAVIIATLSIAAIITGFFSIFQVQITGK